MSPVQPIRLMIAGGGTGGHIFPAIAIANAVRKLNPSSEILFVGAKGKMEMEKVPSAGYKIIGLDIAGLNRSSIWKNISLPFKLIKSFLHAGKIIKDFRPNVAVGVGGYASFPILYMAQRNGISTVIQEQNSFAGKSNKILGKKAKAICVAYHRMERFFPKENILYTGNPVRASIYENKHTQKEGAAFFQLNPDQKIVFAFGGSLGARSINETLKTQFKILCEKNVQLIWQTGTGFFEQAKAAVAGYESQVKVFDFIKDMDYAYAAADVIISRAGASSISELSIIGKPVVFVPFPFASEDHQTHNAMSLVNAKAAFMVPDQLAAQNLMNKVTELLDDEMTCEEMKKNILKLAIPDADLRIAHKIMELAN
ncbi:MAG: undecaprenyldiphospho-muramoylpentapeptide beta-N-acetylglucosaminyltransferase [Chitinophagaceae bacterium]|nr:undecaprenyldiphospho-muramoylpentapeptide beta-N-acetylglucosaminyltransferase [Chitinophagaceae bacterium]